MDDEKKLRERGLDETLAESFPSSDPLSTIPDPISVKPADETASAPRESVEQNTISKVDTAFRDMLQRSFDAAGIKCDLRQVEDKIIAQPLTSYWIAAASGFVVGGGMATRLGWIMLTWMGWRAMRNQARKERSEAIEDIIDPELTSI